LGRVLPKRKNIWEIYAEPHRKFRYLSFILIHGYETINYHRLTENDIYCALEKNGEATYQRAVTK